jgi:hypothetical protein
MEVKTGFVLLVLFQYRLNAGAGVVLLVLLLLFMVVLEEGVEPTPKKILL